MIKVFFSHDALYISKSKCWIEKEERERERELGINIMRGIDEYNL